MYKIIVINRTLGGGIHNLVIEFDTLEAAELAFDCLEERLNKLYDTIIKLYDIA